MTPASRLAENVGRVRERIEDACQAAGRRTSDVQLIAVTKSVGVETIRLLIELGLVDLGENRPQALLEKFELIRSPGVRWHLIGHLQRNKVRKVLPCSHLIHSGDSQRLLEHLDTVAAELGLCAHVLLEVNISGDASKNGFGLEELLRAGPTFSRWTNLRFLGLMGMSGLEASPTEKRRQFAQLRQLQANLKAGSPAFEQLCELSIGMSDDFELAIQEGATMVRIGSALFEGLEPASH